jgi:hypothetical protein
MIDSLTILQRAIEAQRSAPEYAKNALLSRLYRTTAPVLEEREQLIDFLERGWKHTNDNPDVADRERRDTKWIDKLHRLEEIENVLATFPAFNVDSTHKHQTRPSGTLHTERSQMPLHQPSTRSITGAVAPNEYQTWNDGLTPTAENLPRMGGRIASIGSRRTRGR